MTGKHILIAEDDEAYLTSIAFILEDEGYAVSRASNGKTALETIKSAANGNPVDLLITDIQMPEINGLGLIKKIWETGSKLPVIVITGYGDKETLKELIRIGCDDFLDKPFEPGEISEKVRQVLEKQEIIKTIYNKSRDKMLEKHNDLSRELETYKRGLESLQKELDYAVVTYNDLISVRPESYRVKIAWRSRPLRRLGGDYLDVANTPFGCAILVADVAGHDIAASYHTILIKAFFQEHSRTSKDGESFFRILNHALMEKGGNDRMLTAMFVRLDLDSMEGEIVTAGHPSAIKFGDKMSFPHMIGGSGSVLGLLEDPSFDKTRFALVPGDRFFFCTDGVINARYVDGPTGKRHTLREDGLVELIEKKNGLPLEETLEEVWKEVFRFCKYKPSDDMLLLGIQI